MIDTSHGLDAVYHLDIETQAIIEKTFSDRRKLIIQQQMTSVEINTRYPFVGRSPELVGINALLLVSILITLQASLYYQCLFIPDLPRHWVSP